MDHMSQFTWRLSRSKDRRTFEMSLQGSPKTIVSFVVLVDGSCDISVHVTVSPSVAKCADIVQADENGVLVKTKHL
jgi:hypothetical protein